MSSKLSQGAWASALKMKQRHDSLFERLNSCTDPQKFTTLSKEMGRLQVPAALFIWGKLLLLIVPCAFEQKVVESINDIISVRKVPVTCVSFGAAIQCVCDRRSLTTWRLCVKNVRMVLSRSKSCPRLRKNLVDRWRRGNDSGGNGRMECLSGQSEQNRNESHWCSTSQQQGWSPKCNFRG